MNVLGFDTATQSTAVALRLGDGETLSARDDPAAGGHPGHATRLLELAASLLAQAGIGWEGLQRIAVGVGPGRFTGLRVGIASARGLAQSLGIELVGVSSLRALARGAAGEHCAVLAVIDARRGEAFLAAYPDGAQPDRAPGRDPAPADREIAFARPLGEEALAGIVAAIERDGGPAGARWLAVGDGAVHFREQLLSAGAEVAPERSPLHLIDAAAICELGAADAAIGSYELIVPDYRRAPDAALAAPGASLAAPGASLAAPGSSLASSDGDPARSVQA